MAKPNSSKQRPARSLREPDTGVRGRGQFWHEAVPPPKHQQIPLKPVCLIVCEGPTESAYFETLATQFTLTCSLEVLPRLTPNDTISGHRGDTVGLLLTAMQKMRMTRVPYDAVWIVTDNDEGEGYKLDNASLARMAHHLPPYLMDRMMHNQYTEMKVRQKEINRGENWRERYFLHISDYREFLANYILLTEEERDLWADRIIRLTSHKLDYTKLYGSSAGALFYESDGTFKRRALEPYYIPQWNKFIQVAFSSICFEHWLLLHYERNQHGFYNSRELVRYFDDRGYFGGAYHKGWWMYEHRKTTEIKRFFSHATQAIRNSVWLRHKLQTQFVQGKRHYEVNPYTDVDELVLALIYDVVRQEETTNTDFFDNLLIIKRENEIIISFDPLVEEIDDDFLNRWAIRDMNGHLAAGKPTVGQLLHSDARTVLTFALTCPADQPVSVHFSPPIERALPEMVCLIENNKIEK